MARRFLIFWTAVIAISFYLVYLAYSVFFAGPKQPDKIEVNDDAKNIIVAFGDSLTAGYGVDKEDNYPSQLESLLKTKGYDYKVVNAGVSGDVSAGALSRVGWVIDDDNIPKIVILVIGANDGLRAQDLTETKENIINIIDYLQERNINVVLGGMKVPPNLGFEYAGQFADMYYEIAEEKDVFFLEFFLEGVAGKVDLNISDGIHPNKEGYTIIVDNLFEFLEDNGLLDDKDE